MPRDAYSGDERRKKRIPYVCMRLRPFQNFWLPSKRAIWEPETRSDNLKLNMEEKKNIPFTHTEITHSVITMLWEFEANTGKYFIRKRPHIFPKVFWILGKDHWRNFRLWALSCDFFNFFILLKYSWCIMLISAVQKSDSVHILYNVLCNIHM